MHYELGQTLRQSGDLAGAVAAFEKALEIDPELREALLRARAGAEAAERVRAQAARPASTSPADDLFKRAQEAAGARRAERRPRAAHRGPSPRREPRRGAQPARLHAGPAGRSAVGARVTSSARSRSGPSPPRRTTTSASRSGTAASRTGPWPSCGESVTLDPAAGASHAFLGTALRETRRSGRGAGEPAARDRAPAADRRRLRRPRHHLPSRRRARQGAGTARGRAEPSRRRRLPAPDWDAAIAGLRQALAAEPGPRRRAQRPRPAARPPGRRQHRRWPPSSARPSGCGPTSPRPTTISVSC